MIKFTLIIWVCSFLGQNTCMKPLQYPVLFDSWYECTRAAHHESRKMLSSMGYKEVNKNRIAMKYSCQQLETT